MTLISLTNDPGGFPDHNYKQRFFLWANNDFPEATQVDLQSGRYKFQSESSHTVCFNHTVIFDEQGDNAHTGYYWQHVEITSGLDDTETIDWTYDEFTGSNNTVSVNQRVKPQSTEGGRVAGS